MKFSENYRQFMCVFLFLLGLRAGLVGSGFSTFLK